MQYHIAANISSFCSDAVLYLGWDNVRFIQRTLWHGPQDEERFKLPQNTTTRETGAGFTEMIFYLAKNLGI